MKNVAIIFFFCFHFAHGNPKISTHRGNTGVAPENTLATFKKALKLRVNYIEIDVRTSADGQLIILHDATLNRTTNGKGPVKDWDYATLKTLSAGNGKNGFEKEQIPSLDEVCALIARWNKWHTKKTYLYVDCKAVAPGPLSTLLQKYGLAKESCFYGTDTFLASLKEVFPASRLMPSLRNLEDIPAKIELLHPYAFDANWASLTPAILQAAHAQGVQIFTDLLGANDTASNYQKAKELGVDLIQTDKPRLVLETLHN